MLAVTTRHEINVENYRERQAELNALRHELRQRREAFDRENADLIARITQASADTDESLARLTETALKIYSTTGSKQPSEGVGIRVRRTPIITSVDDALAWAIEHRIGLTIDTRRLTGAVAALGLTPSWLEITEETQVTISAELRGKAVPDAR